MADTTLAQTTLWTIGMDLPSLTRGPISRATLALFAGASNDHVPLHIDTDFARAVGMDDVFAHGMLSMAYLGQALTRWAPQERLKRWHVRFTAITPLYATVHCKGKVQGFVDEAGERLAHLHIGAWTDKGIQTLDGEAFVRVS